MDLSYKGRCIVWHGKMESICKFINSYTASKRKHANYFASPRKHRVLGDTSIAEEFSQYFKKAFDKNIVRIVPGDDPPDVIFDVDEERKFGVELTELVNQSAIKAQINGSQEEYFSESFNWDSEKTIRRIECLLERKESGAQNIADSFQRYIVLLHTDEMMLANGYAKKYLLGHKWPDYENITDAYLLCSYEPGKGYPVIKLFGT